MADQPDYSKALFNLAIGYFVGGPLLMGLVIGIVALVRWLL